MGLNLSNSQIAKELGLDKDDVQKMTTQLRQGIVDGKEQRIDFIGNKAIKIALNVYQISV
jgi:hypothetical protein